MPKTEVALERSNVSESAARRVRDMIVSGRLPAGRRVNEVHLALSLGISRTPLREALSRLVAEGALTSMPGRGFSVRPLTLDEFEQLYAIRPLLDPLALRLAGVPPARSLQRLTALNAKMRAARDPESAIALDDAWHMTLLEGCPNRVLVELIEHVILRTRRYELALMREQEHLQHATADHARILSALRKGDLDAACAALEENMRSGREPIVAWLQSRTTPQASQQAAP
jgi:DNA-binding GntR family transcriptional regulator